MFGVPWLLVALVPVVCLVLSSRLRSFRHGVNGDVSKEVSRGFGTVSKEHGKTFKHRMNLQKVERPWLLVDDNYLKEHEIRKTLFESKKEKILGCEPIASHACKELLGTVVEELIQTYPDRFRLVEVPGESSQIKILETGELFRIDDPATDTRQLETAATLAMEDFNILIREEETGEHRVQASASCFPVGWSVDERLNWPVVMVHEAVPRWQKQLESKVERFLSNLSKMAERTGEFVQVADLEREDLSDVLCQTHELQHTKPENSRQIILRTERQTFRRLPKTRAIVFAVKTWMKTLPELDDLELVKFQKEIHSWPDDIAKYKGRGLWGDCVDAYCAKRFGT